MTFHVYRVINESGQTLYIGQTGNLSLRRKQQLNAIEGAYEVRSVSEHPDRASAREAEAALIDAERPPRNRHHNPTRFQPRPAMTDAEMIEMLTDQLAESRLVMLAMAAGMKAVAGELDDELRRLEDRRRMA